MNIEHGSYAGFACAEAGAHSGANLSEGALDVEGTGREADARGDLATGAGCHAANAGHATEAARNDDEEEEIEITPEMIEAGREAICSANAELSPFVSYEDLAEQVYLAMARLAPKRR